MENKMDEMESIINEYINKSTWRIRENANSGYSLSGLKTHIANTVLAREQISNSPAAELHEIGALYLHDLSGGSYSPYCGGHDLQSLLIKGIINPSGALSGPAKHFDVAVDHIVNYIYIAQNEFEGAQAFSNFDTLLAPFIATDNLKYRQVKQNLQRMVYNLSYPLRAAFQSPFSNLSFDLKCPDHMKDEPVIIGGEPHEWTYSEFQDEMDVINLAFIEVMLEGDQNGRPHTFPIPTYSVTRDFDWDCEVTNRLFELTAKFGLPYFMNYCGSGLNPNSVRAMCCRLNLDLNEIIDQSKGGLWNTGVSTGSIGVVSINMSQLGYYTYLLGGSIDVFYNRLDNLLIAAKDHLIYKRKKVEEGFERGLMPFTRSYLQNFNSYFSTIGIIGMNECCLNLYGKPIYECMDFVEGVLGHINKRTKQFTQETGHPWNLEETPAESACYKLAKRDKERYPAMITQGYGEGIYYTNSSHIAVGDGLGLGESLKVQERYKKYYTGGTLFHIFAGEGSPGPEGVKDLIRNICMKTSLPYLAFTRAYSICPRCGMSDDLSGVCPICNGVTDVFDRVTGFYQPVRKYNDGKMQEFNDRKRYF